MKDFLKGVLANVVGMVIGATILVVFLPLLFYFLFSTVKTGGVERLPKSGVLHLRMSGVVVERAQAFDFDWMSGFSREQKSIPLFETIRALKKAETDERIKGVYIDVRHFSSGWASLQELRRAVVDFRKSKKFVYAFADSYDEKGYYLASSADRVYMEPYGELEVNGLGMSAPFFKGLLEKLEVKPLIFRVGKFKAAVEPFLLDKMSDENRLQNQTLLNDIWTVSSREMLEGKKISPEEFNSGVGTLRFSAAAEAKAAGLVDLAYEDEVLKIMATLAKPEHEGQSDPDLLNPVHYISESKIRTKLSSSDVIAVLVAEGEIVKGPGGRDQIGEESIARDLHEIRDDKDVKAVVIRVNSPGGDALASDAIWREVELTKAKMPVVISMGDVAASGGYYMSAAGTKIFADPLTITGSIGVFGLMFNAENLFKNKAAVNFDRVVTHPSADVGSSVREMTVSEQAAIQKSVERVYTRFLTVVKDGRKFKGLDEVAGIAEGRVWSGVRAKEIGLVDEMGGLQDAIRKAKELAGLKVEPSIELYPEQKDPFNEFLHGLSSKIESRLLRSVLEEVFRDEMSVVENVKSWLKPGVYTRMPFDLQIK